ncbi:MAG: ABC transporter substrate-binding protein [Candidatus Neomarinimicrobiota bacterium]
MKKLLTSLLMVILVLSLFSCSSKDPDKVVIAQQFGLGYAPLTLVKELNLIEKYYPNAKIEWAQLGSGGSIREAMAAGQVDVGSMGVPPFLIAWAKGYDYKIMTALCEMPLGLQTNRPEVKSLKDISPQMKIATPSPGSIQHILLSMASEKELGDATALDRNVIAMAHPDAANALINKIEIAAHFTSPPYIFMELESEGIHQVVDAEKDAFGEAFTFLVTAGTGKFKTRNPELFEAVNTALREAIAIMENDPGSVSDIVAPTLNLDRETYLRYCNWPGVKFETEPRGMLKFLDFMNRAGYVSKTTSEQRDLMW